MSLRFPTRIAMTLNALLNQMFVLLVIPVKYMVDGLYGNVLVAYFSRLLAHDVNVIFRTPIAVNHEYLD